VPRGRLRRGGGAGRARLLTRFGFEQASGKGLGNEYGVGDHFMVAEFRNGALDGVSGTVRYREESLNTRYPR